ncbi:MAG: tetratricopeptide repeat protein [Xanthomonadales bacterium]|nr:tetratricopeptide repeat protein [Xanthomonadales bacterium]
MADRTPEQDPFAHDDAYHAGDPRPFWGFVAFVVIAGLGAIAWFVPMLPVEEGELTVDFSRGEAIVKSADGTVAELVPGTTLEKGDRLMVSEGGSVTMTSIEGHQFVVTDEATLEASGSTRSLLGGRTKSRVTVTSGSAKVTGSGRPGSTLDIGLPNGVAGVRGTTFEVNVIDSRTAISLHDGEIGVAGPGQAVNLRPGRGALIDANGTTVRDLPWAPEEFEVKTEAVVRSEDKLVAWLPVENATGYVVEFSTDPEFLEIVGHTQVGPDDRMANIPLLEVDETVYSRVYAIADDGLIGPPSNAGQVEMSLHWANGLQLQEAGQLSESLEEFQLAQERFPENAELLKDIGWSHYLFGNYEEARKIYERGRSLNPNYTDLLFQLGRTYFWLEDYAAAEDAFRSILAQNPDHAHALWGLGDMYRVLGNKTEAQEYVEQALALQPDHPYALETLSRLGNGG